MADNLDITAGTGTTIAADEIAGVLHQRAKISLGADGSAADAVGGTGTANAGVQRITLATNDAAVIALQALAAAADGTELQMDIVAPLPAGTNAIGKLAANSGVDIGDVDVTSVPADPFGTNADAASVSGSLSAKIRSLATNLAAVIAGSELQVDVVGPLPAGTNSIGTLGANSGVDIGDVDVTSVPTDPFGANADAASSTGSISSKLRQLATDIAAMRSGSEMQVDIVASLPAGTNAIGKLAENSGVDIGDVDVLSLPADPFGANADAAATTGSISAKLARIAADINAIVSGSEAQVDVVAPLPAGDNNIGNVDIASSIPAGTNNIGDVDIASSLPAGDNNIGNVDIASALPTGSNTIGAVTGSGNFAVTNDGLTGLADATQGEYETVAESQTTQTIGPTGATGDFLAGLLVVPASTSPGIVQIKDGADSPITVFTGGADSVSNLVPFPIPLNMISAAGAWQVTTGANVSVVAIGNFSA